MLPVEPSTGGTAPTCREHGPNVSDAIPTPETLTAAVTARYATLASTCGSLSCGAALDLAAPRPGETVVDLGCGRGRDVLRAADRVGPGGAAIGVDLSDEMLAEAARRTALATNVRLVRSPMAPLGLSAGLADVVVSNCAINHAPDKAAVFREVYRVLRPGGRFVVSDVVAERELPESVRSDPAAWAACYGGAIPEHDYLAAVRGAGFHDLDVLHRSEPYDKGGVRVLSLTLRGKRP
jgi:SAM-dependent methyltransferase